ncbi:hypothetical protein NDU88_001145 [Pleurodeles waltl]|uniref:Uncharacterized protein n=1 Tax=Pleurodeles waltl TaxID=8319 RepID=A0AAV7RBZ3_PLEWA|nr:hypothetical protein NDU88_001145 [Pleurodeles waltl]
MAVAQIRDGGVGSEKPGLCTKMTSHSRPYKVVAVGERVFLALAYRTWGPQWPQQEIDSLLSAAFKGRRGWREWPSKSHGEPYGFELSSPDPSYSQW